MNIKRKMVMLTFIKHSFKRCLWEKLIDLSQDIWLVGTGSVPIPNLNDVFSVSYTDADPDDLVLCKHNHNRDFTNLITSMGLSEQHCVGVVIFIQGTLEINQDMFSHIRHTSFPSAPYKKSTTFLSLTDGENVFYALLLLLDRTYIKAWFKNMT